MHVQVCTRPIDQLIAVDNPLDMVSLPDEQSMEAPQSGVPILAAMLASALSISFATPISPCRQLPLASAPSAAEQGRGD
jgi:hypothetical protein